MNYIRYPTNFNSSAPLYGWEYHSLSKTFPDTTVMDPDGGYKSCRIYHSGSIPGERHYVRTCGSGFIRTPYAGVFSVHLYSSTNSWICMYSDRGAISAGEAFCYFQLAAAGSVGDHKGVKSQSITPEGGGWFHCQMEFKLSYALDVILNYVYTAFDGTHQEDHGIDFPTIRADYSVNIYKPQQTWSIRRF